VYLAIRAFFLALDDRVHWNDRKVISVATANHPQKIDVLTLHRSPVTGATWIWLAGLPIVPIFPIFRRRVTIGVTCLPSDIGPKGKIASFRWRQV